MYNCFKCENNLPDVTGTFDDLHPSDGLHFMTYGHYGSTYFDPMDGSSLHLIICDDCLKKSKFIYEREANA